MALRSRESESLSVLLESSRPHGLHSPWNSPGQNTGFSLLQGIFPTQGFNPGLPNCRLIIYQLSHKGSPRILEWVAISFSGDLPNPGIQPRSPSLQADSLPAEPQEKPKNSGLGSLSHLQQIFLIQGSNWHPLHCRWILYQLSYEGSPLRSRERSQIPLLPGWAETP